MSITRKAKVRTSNNGTKPYNVVAHDLEKPSLIASLNALFKRAASPSFMGPAREVGESKSELIYVHVSGQRGTEIGTLLKSLKGKSIWKMLNQDKETRETDSTYSLYKKLPKNIRTQIKRLIDKADSIDTLHLRIYQMKDHRTFGLVYRDKDNKTHEIFMDKDGVIPKKSLLQAIDTPPNTSVQIAPTVK